MDTPINPTAAQGTAQSSQRIVWIPYSILVAAIFLIYISTNLAISGGDPIMPLDDAYIHFQYGRQMANGQPYIYNPGDEATSGDSSLIYPVILAVGHLLGFDELRLGLWAVGVGAAAFLASTWLIYLTVRVYTGGGLAIASGIAFLLTGAMSWHFMSGMETGLVVVGALWTLYTLSARKLQLFAFALTFLAVTRPEGSIMALIAVVVIMLEAFITPKAMTFQITRKELLWLLLPIPAVFLQSIINLIFTGSVAATGGVAKSILSTVPFYWDAVLERILDNFIRMWREFATGTEGRYYPVFIPALALLGWIRWMIRPQRRTLAILLLGWFVIVSAAIATLDTAFWHFKRYQIPLMALMFPLAAVGIQTILNILSHYIVLTVNWRTRFSMLTLSGLVLGLFFLPTWVDFQRLYRINVHNVVIQPLAMASWLRNNTLNDAVVAVHDVGMMRYYGARHTLDMVGLTTKGAADAWRNGPGAVAEFIDDYVPQPDYIAAYTSAHGLNYLVDAGIYGELLVGFPATYDPADNVALAAEFQGIYHYEEQSETNPFMTTYSSGWATTAFAKNDDPTDIDAYLSDEIDVADVADEQNHFYEWMNEQHLPGFATEVYDFEFIGCLFVDSLAYETACRVREGGRRINGEEAFTMSVTSGQDAVLVTRIHAVNPGTIDIYANEQFVDRQWIPALPGYWTDIGTLISANLITQDTLNIRITVDVPDGHYMPYYHWLFQGEYNFPTEYVLQELDPSTEHIATYQDGAFDLSMSHSTDNDRFTAEVVVDTNGQATGDYRFFLHLYDDPNAEPIAQQDGYLVAEGVPPGNWLPGVIGDRLTVDLADVKPGVYQMAIGFYNPYTFERLLPDSVAENIMLDTETRRIFVGEVEIPERE